MLRVAHTANLKLVGKLKGLPFFASYREVGRTCPSSCPLLGDGCYAQEGNVAIQQRGRSSSDDGSILIQSLKMMPPSSLVRHHVSGDFMLDGVLDTAYLAAAIMSAHLRPDIQFYGYTHAWREIDRKEWRFPDNFTLNASVDSLDQIEEAEAAGWPVAVTISEKLPPKGKGYAVCPNQTHGISCWDCRLCLRQKRKIAVAFYPHGRGRKKIERRLSHETQVTR